MAGSFLEQLLKDNGRRELQRIEQETEDTESESIPTYIPKEEKLFGSCVLQIQIENGAEYLRWRKYNGGPQRWDYAVTYPAIMRATYDFHTTSDLDMITHKVVQLLQMGFKVRAVNWQLKDYKSQLEE